MEQKIKIERPMDICNRTSKVDKAWATCMLFNEPGLTDITFRDVLAQTHLGWLAIEKFYLLN